MSCPAFFRSYQICILNLYIKSCVYMSGGGGCCASPYFYPLDFSSSAALSCLLALTLLHSHIYIASSLAVICSHACSPCTLPHSCVYLGNFSSSAGFPCSLLLPVLHWVCLYSIFLHCHCLLPVTLRHSRVYVLLPCCSPYLYTRTSQALLLSHVWRPQPAAPLLPCP